MNVNKHVKKDIKKKHKKELAKSLADALKKVKQDNHEKKFSKTGEVGKKSPGSSGKKGKKRSHDSTVAKKKQAELDSLTPSAKKRRLRQERQAKKPNFSLVESMKEFWNAARVKTLSREDRDALIDGMMKSVSGRILQVTLRHDASRAVQCILQFGSEKQRKQILEEMSPKLYEIAKTPYGHFTVLKATSYCNSAADQALIHNSLRGHFVSLGTNVIGARSCESVMQLFPKKLTKGLKAEFYGQKFVSLLQSPPGSLQELIAAQTSKRESIMDHMRDLIQKFVDKGLLEFTYSHNLIWEYTQQCLETYIDSTTSGNVDPKANPLRRLSDLVGLLSESAPKLLSTKPGSKTICIVVTYATAKDRKKLMKSLKGHVLESLLHNSAHLGILRLIDVTDDTVNVQKMLLDEIRTTKAKVSYSANGELISDSVPPLVSIAKHPQGCKLLLRLLSPQKKHLEPDEEMLFSQDGVVSSKKPPAVRRQEHVAYLRAPLLQVCTRYVEELARCRNGSRVLLEVIGTFFPSSLLKKLASLLTGQPFTDEDDAFEEDDDDEDNHEGKESDSHSQDDSDSDSEKKDAMEVTADSADDDRKFDDEEISEDDAGDGKEENGKPLLPLEEDMISQKLIRKVLELQALAESGQMDNISKLTADWEMLSDEKSISSAKNFYPFAKFLGEALCDSNNISDWIARNRPAFLLSDLIAVPSAQEVVLNAFSKKSIMNALKKQAKAHAGGKCLLDSVKSASNKAR